MGEEAMPQVTEQSAAYKQHPTPEIQPREAGYDDVRNPLWEPVYDAISEALSDDVLEWHQDAIRPIDNATDAALLALHEMGALSSLGAHFAFVWRRGEKPRLIGPFSDEYGANAVTRRYAVEDGYYVWTVQPEEPNDD